MKFVDKFKEESIYKLNKLYGELSYLTFRKSIGDFTKVHFFKIIRRSIAREKTRLFNFYEIKGDGKRT